MRLPVKPRPYRIEACVVSVEQAVRAAAAGADRLEVCRDPDNGGLTPAWADIREICRLVGIPVRVLIRSTPDGFETDRGILAEMISDIQRFRKLPVEGFVFGVMRGGALDTVALKELVKASGDRPCTFHKAIDTSSDLGRDITALHDFPAIDTVLTSGGAETALGGLSGILNVKDLFAGEVMAAGRIRPEDLPGLHAALGLAWYHGRAIAGPL